VGLPLTDTVVTIRPASRLAPDDRDADALVQEALTTHPTLRQAALAVERADNGRRTARASLLPTVGLQGGWELNGATLGSQQSSWVIGAEVRVNLFRGFADTARITEARHAQDRATSERERVAQQVEVDLRAALAQLAAARAREEAGRAALTQARESQRIVRDRYDNGLATITDVLQAAEGVLGAESRATSAAMATILQAVALDHARGRL
jgi:outer membrane protein